MSTSTGAFSLAAHNRKKSPRKVIHQNLKGGAAVACLVLGCAWTVYANVFGSGIYPAMDSAVVDGHVGKPPAIVAVRRAPAFNEVFASLPPQAPQISPPETTSASIMFNERFAAAAPQSAAPALVEAPQLAEASPASEAPKLVQLPPKPDASKIAEASKKVEAPKLADASKTKDAASTRLALNMPASPMRPADAKSPEAKSADVKSADAKSPGATVRDMAQRAKAAVMSIASSEKQTMVEKLWGKQPSHGSLLSYASADASVTGSLGDEYGKKQNPMLGGSPPYDRQTAVYDIAARKVYLPDGTTLEAHSGLGSKLDDVRYAHVRMQGVTPPHIYELKPREALFHGVPALRLTPVGGEDAIFGRSGLLAHTYMLGPNGDSNGCVSFKDYYAFLNAYKTQGIKRLAVLARIQ